MTFTYLDIFIAAVIVFSILMGLMRGFIREILSLICWIVAFAMAFNFQHLASVFFESHIGSPEIRGWAGFITVFIIALLGMSLLTMIVYKMFAATGITGADRGLGILFGFLRGVFIIAAMVAVVGLTSIPRADFYQRSALVGYFDPVARMIVDILPERVRNQFQAPLDPNAPRQSTQPQQQQQQLQQQNFNQQQQQLQQQNFNQQQQQLQQQNLNQQQQ